MRTRAYSYMSLILMVAAVGCGLEPREPRVVTIKNTAAPTPEELEASAEGSPYAALLKIPAMRQCHEQGVVYERLTGSCSEAVRLASSYGCDRQSILEAFAATGYQIEEVLNGALGKASDPNDRGEGFEIDQCGERESGELIIYLFKKELIDGQPQLRLREIESKR